MLTDLVAAKLRKAGSIPKNNKYVDLSAVWGDDLYSFEMKSTTDQNIHSQIRRAISQLYEYRYLQQVPAAKLVIVVENPPPQEKKWIVDYIVQDRKVLITWDGDRKTLKYPAESNSELHFP
jgi:Holliday junction resolvase